MLIVIATALLDASKWPDSETVSEWYRIPPAEAAKRPLRFNGRAEPVRTAEVLTQPDSVPSTALSGTSSSADTVPHYSSIMTRVDVHLTDMDADENSSTSTTLPSPTTMESQQPQQVKIDTIDRGGDTRAYVTRAQQKRVVRACDQVSAGRHSVVVSYNMRGFNLGRHVVRDFIHADSPDVLLLQEHWLTLANLNRFDEVFLQFSCFGSSAMSSAVERGALRDRPFGVVMTLVSKPLHSFTKIVCATNRYVIVIVGNSLIINVYFPCVGTADRLLVYEEVIDNLTLWVQRYPSRSVLIGGDFNTDLDKASPVTQMLCKFSL